jgi:hypothetical protein
MAGRSAVPELAACCRPQAHLFALARRQAAIVDSSRCRLTRERSASLKTSRVQDSVTGASSDAQPWRRSLEVDRHPWPASRPACLETERSQICPGRLGMIRPHDPSPRPADGELIRRCRRRSHRRPGGRFGPSTLFRKPEAAPSDSGKTRVSSVTRPSNRSASARPSAPVRRDRARDVGLGPLHRPIVASATAGFLPHPRL